MDLVLFSSHDHFVILVNTLSFRQRVVSNRLFTHETDEDLQIKTIACWFNMDHS